jgi:hypothetical protein
LEELQSIFLVNEPNLIESEDRFSISNTTYLLVSENLSEMAFDYQKLKTVVKTMKAGVTDKKTGNRRLIGMTINQSLALIKEGRIADAIETVDLKLRMFVNNPDLLLMKARCLTSKQEPDYGTIRTLLKKSIESGQSKELAYELLYRSELALGSPNGMLEVSTRALELKDSNPESWLKRLAGAYVTRAENRDAGAAIQDLMEASLALTKSLEWDSVFSRDLRIEELHRLHDLIWIKLERDLTYSWLSSFDIVMTLIKRGDSRTSVYSNARRCLDEARTEGKMSKGKIEAYGICVKKFINQMESRSASDKRDKLFLDLSSGLDVSGFGELNK